MESSSVTTSICPMKTMDIGLDSRCGQDITLKLRRNRRIESKWGTHYYTAVQSAVCGKCCIPYMPTEPPASLSEEIVESDPLYVCKQCKDCFRFQDSFEVHNKRRSWILGFWCQRCFITICTHISETDSVHKACPMCIKKDTQKRAYLRTRGLTKNQKLGAIKIFYNQCQFLEHVNTHGLSTVDMGDIMLMPLPSDMSDDDWSPEVEIICEALMERTFLFRTHIMDWLKKYNLQDNWWKLVNGKSVNCSINKVVQGYQGRQLFKTLEKLTTDQFTDFAVTNFTSPDAVHKVSKNPLDIGFTNSSFKDKNKNSYSTNMILDKNISENEDNPCMSTDITFVDCGPTSQCFEPESSPAGYIPRRRTTVVTKSVKNTTNWQLVDMAKTNKKRKIPTFTDLGLLETDTTRENTTPVKPGDNSSNKNFIIQSFARKTMDNSISKSMIETGVSKILDDSVKISIPFSTKKIILPKTNSDHLGQDLQNTSIINNSSKIVLQGPKNADITSIINQLPSHLISNKKIVFIGQDSHKVIDSSKHKTIIEKKSNKSVIDDSDADINASLQNISESIKKQETSLPCTGKLVIKNGKKYLIKHTKNVSVQKCIQDPTNLPILQAVKRRTLEHSNTSSLTSTNSSEAEIGIEYATSLHNDISLLTPSPSPSELSSNSSCESHVKKTSIASKLRKVPSHLITVCSVPPNQKKHLFEMISLIKEDNGDYYMGVKIVDRISKEGFREAMVETIPKYRLDMIDEFYQLDSYELKKRIDHLQFVSEEMEKALDFISGNVLKEKLRSISTLQRILEECFHKSDQDVQDKNNDTMLNDWESELKKTDPTHKCPSCNKIMKPKSYIAGFSKLSKDDDAYCFCYKQVCHECLSYQGTVSRFVTHQNYHKKNKPYVCPDCYSKFASAKSLEVHTWTVCFHTLKKRVFACKICEIDGFRDMESITRHFAIMHSNTRFACEDCFKVFSSYGEYTKHYTEAHPSLLTKQNPIRLVICKLGNVVVRCENYMLYLDKYPGIRKLIWFKCPFCSLITLENKHMTTVLNIHLRNKHLHCLPEIISKEALVDIFGEKILNSETNEILEDFGSTFVNETPCVDGTIIPRIVNTRTISSEIFESGSQDTEDIWSTNADGFVDVSSRTTEKINDTDKAVSLPKINVKSINDLKPSKPKQIITTSLTETKKKLSSQSREIIVEIEVGKDPLAHKNAKETTMEINEGKPDSKEETEKTEEPNESNDELIALRIPEFEKSSLTNTDDTRVNSSGEWNKTLSDLTSDVNIYNHDIVSKANIDGHIKVVDIKKICKPSIEPLVAAEPCDTQMMDESASYMASIPEPPPLARIPQHLLEPRKASEAGDKSRNVARSKKFLAHRTTDKSKGRIAIHGLPDEQGKFVCYRCHLCNERINTSRSVVRTHFRERHSHEYKLVAITPQLLRLSADFINGGYRQFTSSKKRKSDSALYVSKRKRRWTPKKHSEMKDASAPVGLCVEQETAEDGEGNFKCKKCGQRCTDMSDLRQHIAANHRLKGRYLICLECGENFVVAPSLQMHLKAFHGIEDPINYMNQNPSYAPGVDGDVEAEGRTTVANQCHVCMAVFEDKAAVDKHLRVHGMAFLNRKRIEARNALKSPDKKANGEEEKRSVVKDSPKEIVKRDKPAETILEKLNAAI